MLCLGERNHERLEMNQKIDLAVVPLEHQKMVSTITRLPDIQIQAKTRDQRILLIDQKNFWRFVAIRINFFQLVRLGYTPLDPLNDERLHPFQYEKIDVMSRYYFAILQLVIEAFPIIREVTVSERRSFPFENPRELFAQICRDNANGGTAELQSNELNQGFELKALRKNLRMWDAFYRDGDALPEKKHDAILFQLKTGDLSGFWIFTIWKDKTRKPLRDTWKNFRAAHKAVCQFADKNNYPNGEVTMIKLNAGKAFCSNSMQPVNSWGTWQDNNVLNIS